MTLISELLLALLFLPLVTAGIVAMLGKNEAELVRRISLLSTIVCAVLSFIVAGAYMGTHTEAATPATFLPEFVPGPSATSPHATRINLLPLGTGSVQFFIGVDGLNVWLIVLTAVLMVPSVLISWTAVEERTNEYYAWLLVLQTAMTGIFLSFDIILFYVFFEMSLVPLFFLIGIWGGPQRRHAAGKFFIFTLTGSLLTLLGVIAIVLACQQQTGELTFSLPRLTQIVHESLQRTDPATMAHWRTLQTYVFLALIAGFAVKVPLVPLHTWLPLAHVEAPTAGSVLLAGILLKVGAYGFLRICLPLTPDACLAIGLPLVSWLSVIGIIYGSLCAFAQEDIKKMVAYSSVAHLGMCMLGMFALNEIGLTGSLVQMINHGLSTGGLFLLVGMLYERYHTRNMSDYGGMATKLPLLGFFMVFICLTSVGLPFLNGFIGEALVLFGAFEQQYVTANQWPTYAVLASTGMVLGAWYLFTMLQKVFFGTLKEPQLAAGHEHHPIHDLNSRELWAIVPIAALCVLIGVLPQPLIDTSKPDLKIVAAIMKDARARAEKAPTVALADRKEQAP
jgi:NADH-quinone oxidoreductase subunit M